MIMSADGNQMERELSSQSLVRDNGTENESRYISESGFYMTSLAATIFIGGIVTIGVLLVTLVISLGVMLQSCQSKSQGVVGIENEGDSNCHCEILALHRELNGFKPDNEVTPLCRTLAKRGGYERDLDFTMWMIESFFDTISPSNDHAEVVLMDIDDILGSDPWLTGVATYLKHQRTLQLYKKLRSRGWSLILLSRKPETQRNVTIKHLNSIGYNGWSSLIMRSNREMEIDTSEYFRRRREEMKKQCDEIISVISSQMDALTGLSKGIHVFKLPNPLFYNFENRVKYTNGHSSIPSLLNDHPSFQSLQ